MACMAHLTNIILVRYVLGYFGIYLEPLIGRGYTKLAANWSEFHEHHMLLLRPEAAHRAFLIRNFGGKSGSLGAAN